MATVLFTGCGAPGLDHDQTAEEQRTCASLRERVAARALNAGGLLGGEAATEDKGDGLSPLVLVEDPAAWYATLDAAIDRADFGPGRDPTPLSPASRLVERCRRLGR